MKKHKRLAKVVRMVYSSLESHLPYCHKKSSEGKKFHRKCTAEYSEIIRHLAKLMEK